MSWDETKKDRSGGCHFTPCPKNCLSCPYPECINNRPPVRGEDGVDRYVNLTDGTKENAMKTKYSVGDTVKVGAKIEKIEIDEKGVKYMLSSGFWKGFKEVREGDLSSGSSRSVSKTSAKTEKTLAKNEKTLEKTEKTSKNGRKRQKTAENGKEKQRGGTEGVKAAKRQQDTVERQQERKRPGRPSKKAAGESEGTTTAAGLKELAKELAGAAE